MQYRICTKCGMEKPMTFEFFGVQQTNHKRFLTECRECKKIYQLRYQEKKRLNKDVESKRMKQLYVFPNLTKEQKQKRMKEAYAYIYYQAFDESISQKQWKEIEGIEE